MALQGSSRRRFLQNTLAAGGAAALTVLSWSRVWGANERLRVASVGVAGKGWEDHTLIAESPYVEIVALCDVDDDAEHLGKAAEKYPQAKRYSDFRRLFEQSRDFDAVIVSTPDHMHAPIALPAMKLGKHVFCQKPLTHTVFEARQMRLAADKYRLVTQMGNQIQSHQAYRTAVKLVHDGVIGRVEEVHSWQSGSMRWILADDRPAGADPIPQTLHWDDWLGVAPQRPYKKLLYHSFNWRAWQDFSNGQLGDFGCHILDPVFLALGLTAPTTVRAEAPAINREVWTKRSTVHYQFPGTERTAGKTLALTWYDGKGHLPLPEAHGLPKEQKLPQAGSVLIGEKGSLVIPHVAMPKLFPKEKFADFKIEVVPAVNHYTSWADACRGEGKTTSSFAYAGPLTETVLLGTIAIRNRGETLRWDSTRLTIPNSTAANDLLTKRYRKGWEPSWIG
ncbi:MAG TPA: Gfo/Idh/MocA family oxidoreductase [Gemmataceae bacterium]|nr:Gfo/Idh/MocA family oxidoreductase [Gemmataceae bacterium]